MQAIRYRLIIKYLGGVLLVLGCAFLVTAVVSFVFGEGPRFYAFYLLVFAGPALGGWELYRKVPEREANAPEAAAIASLSFLAASILGALPFHFLDAMPVVDAWFEAMSGFTTTGFSLMDVTRAPASLLFLRAFSQWLGGMGFVVITVSILLVTGKSAVVLLKEGIEEKLFPKVAHHIQVIVVTYILLTALGVALLLFAGVGFFSALCYTLSGVSTGGFAIDPGSISDLPHGAWLPVVFTMVAGSVNFVLYYRSFKTHEGIWAGLGGIFKNSQVVALLLLILVVGLGIDLTLNGQQDSLLNGIFLAASAQTTTGYYTLDPVGLPAAALMLIIASMFIGGSLGSTAGGMKLFRLIEFTRSIKGFLLSQYYPRDVVPPGGTHGVAKDDLAGIFYVIAIYGLSVFIGSTIFIWSGYDPLRSVFEVTSAVGTVGLSAGLVTPALAGGLKVLLIFLMWAGRLEFLPIIIWLYSITLYKKS